MKIFWLRFLLAAGLVSLSAGAVASGTLEVALRYPADPDGVRFDRGAGQIEVVLSNRGRQSMGVDVMTVPEPNRDGFLLRNLFDVRTDDGGRVGYLGIDMTLASLEGPYTTIPAGGELVLTVDMMRNYRLRPGGSYEVRMLPVRYLSKTRDNYSLYSPQEIHKLVSEAEPYGALSLRLAPDVEVPPQELNLKQSNDCEEWQLEEFNQAKLLAHSLAAEALSHYDSLFSVEDVGGSFVFGFDASQRYTRWFGADPIANPWEWSQDDSYLFATLLAIPERLESDLLSVTRSCDADGVKPETMAYVQRPIHYIVNVCPAFWDAPSMPEFKDQPSRIGTLVHEASHFRMR